MRDFPIVDIGQAHFILDHDVRAGLEALELCHMCVEHTPARFCTPSGRVFDLVGEFSNCPDDLKGSYVPRLELGSSTAFHLLPPDDH